MGVKCFFVEPTERARQSLRRYSRGAADPAQCQGEYSYHNAHAPLGDVLRPLDPVEKVWKRVAEPDIPHDDPRWPRKCDRCDYLFTGADEFQVFEEQVYSDQATGQEYTLRDGAPGMMWDAFWMSEFWRGPDGRCLVVVCPNGREWMIDSQASNCTMKSDTGPEAHRCWTRTGTPPLIQVGKQYGKTCGAGGGSIQAGDYHGFLGNGGAAPGYFT